MASSLLRRNLLAARTASRGSLFAPVQTNARCITHYYGALERNVKGSAGAKPEAVELPYVDRIRAEHLLKLRMHIGHQKRKMDRDVAGVLYGFRHNVAIYDITKTWDSLRTLFYGFAEMAQLRSSFFLLAPNPHLPLKPLIEKMRKEYPFQYNSFSSLYMTGYSDKKWVDGTFTNWRMTVASYEYVSKMMKQKPGLKRFRKYARYLRGISDVDVMGKIIPDFVLVFATDRGALHEAKIFDLPLIGLVDSNTNPLPFLYPVYGNDDSIETIQFMLELLKRAVEEGRKKEHEAFATMLVKKIKTKLDPNLAGLSMKETDTDADRLIDEDSLLIRAADERRQPSGELPYVR